jgi:tetratricopeptide (TPR) repeat protein
MNHYFIKTAVGEHGPIPEDQVRALAANGQLQPTDQIRPENNQQWRFAREIRGYVSPASIVRNQPSHEEADAPLIASPRSNPPLIGAVALGASIVTGTVVWVVMFMSRSAALPNASAPSAQRGDAPFVAKQSDTLTVPAKPDPNPRQIRMDAQAALDADNLDLAERLFRSLTELEPAIADHRISIGRVLLKREDAGGAAAAFRSAIRLDPNSAGALDGLGDALLAAEEIRGAVESWESALALRPHDATVSMKLLLVYTLVEKWDKAVPLAEGLAEQNRELRDSPINRPIKTSSLAMLATAYAGAGRTESAEAVYREILSVDASHSGALVGLAGIAIDKRDLASARAMLGRIESPTADSLFLLCRVEALSENTFAAVRASRESLAKDPKQPERWFVLAVLENAADRPSDAIAAVDKAIEGDGSNPKFRLLRARSLLSANRFQEALDEADRAKSKGASAVETHLLRGRSLLGLGRFTEGVAALRLAVSDGTDSRTAAASPHALISAKQAALALAQVLSEQEKWDEVADVYGTIASISDEDADTWRERRALAHRRGASARYKRGDTEGQLRQLRLAVEASPSATNKAALVNALAIKALGLMQGRQHDDARRVVQEIAPMDRSEAAKLTRMLDESEELDRQGEELRRRREQPPPANPSVPTSGTVESTIKSKFTGKVFDHGNLFEFQNGQIWKQTEYYIYYHYAYGPSVLVYRDGAVWKMKVEGVDHAVTVERVK